MDMNLQARENLLGEINSRMAATNTTMVWKLKYGLDKAEFARNHILTEPMKKVEDFLLEASKEIAKAVADFQRDIDAFYNMAKVAKEIGDSEKPK